MWQAIWGSELMGALCNINLSTNASGLRHHSAFSHKAVAKHGQRSRQCIAEAGPSAMRANQLADLAHLATLRHIPGSEQTTLWLGQLDECALHVSCAKVTHQNLALSQPRKDFAGSKVAFCATTPTRRPAVHCPTTECRHHSVYFGQVMRNLSTHQLLLCFGSHHYLSSLSKSHPMANVHAM